jgi:hypothetical protein
VTNNLIMTAAAACPNTTAMPAGAIMPSAAAAAWRNRVPAQGVDSGIRGTSVFETLSTNHNSNGRKLAVSVDAYRGVDAKQAAPPRGVLR